MTAAATRPIAIKIDQNTRERVKHLAMDIEYRELLIDFGDSGYVALYCYEGDLVTALPLRHQKEAGY